eukprot:jgi/Ulvmu1/11594/UM079_0038.1
MDNGVEHCPWAEPVEVVLNQLDVDSKCGLTSDEAERRIAKHGPNELSQGEKTSQWQLFIEQFDDALVKVLLLAAAISFGLALLQDADEGEGIREFIEPFVILLILILNAIVGVWQESNAENALESLKKMQPQTCTVLRDAHLTRDFQVVDLVPGDIIELRVGDKVPADARILRIHTATLRAEQSSLTGESMAVIKSEDPVAQAQCELQLKDNMLFSSTAIANGSCTAVITTTGMQTEVGNIHADIQAASEEDSDTPLKRKLNAFGELLALIIAYICAAVWVINYSHFVSWKSFPGSFIPDLRTVTFSMGRAIYYFKIAVALAVAAIPEGLPAVITTCLALGTRSMAKRNAIIRRLPSVETLGCTTVICSDKTGTLTTNQMSATTVFTLSPSSASRTFDVKGTSYNPGDGHVVGLSALDAVLHELADICTICNESALTVDEASGAFQAAGAPTEAALLVLAEKLGVPNRETTIQLNERRQAASDKHPMPITAVRRAASRVIATLEFDRRRKSMSVIVEPRGSAPAPELLVKGAAECVLQRCSHVMLPDQSVVPLDAARSQEVTNALTRMTAGALRVLAFATRSLEGTVFADYHGERGHKAHAELQDISGYEEIESGLTLVGLIGLQDPPRPEVRDAIRDCNAAGVRVIVITGDNKNTADAICRSIGVFDWNEDITSSSMTAREFSLLPQEDKLKMLGTTGSLCFSRAEPRDKQDIVRLLRAQGEITAMTGDGVNDAPALKLADIGVAMGIAGTEVAKEASDMVLADDNFSTIVAAVSEGRSIFDNMKAFIRYMISSNIGEVASIFFTALLGLPEGMIPVQLLWVNLVTDGPPATALGFNPADPEVMHRPPRSPSEPLITTWVLIRYIIVGTYVGFATVGIFAAWYLFPTVLGLHIDDDGHSNVSWYQLTHFDQCRSWAAEQAFAPAMQYTVAGHGIVSWSDPCDIFGTGKIKASTLSLTVLVTIEMLNALNALSEDSSLLRMPPWCNPWLLVAMAGSFAMHFLIMYVPFLASVFSIVPLMLNEWLLVLMFSAPVILIDEILKLAGRRVFNPILQTQKSKSE